MESPAKEESDSSATEEDDDIDPDRAEQARLAQFHPKYVMFRGKLVKIVDWDFDRGGLHWGHMDINCKPNKASIGAASKILS